MKKSKKRILIAAPVIILAAIFSFYFVFPGIVYKFLVSRERSAAGLIQKSIDINELHIEYLEGGKGDVLVLLHGFGGILSSQPSELSQRLESGEPNPLIVENKKDYDRLIDFVFVKRPSIPGAIKRYFTQEAIHHRPLNQIIFKQIRSADDFIPLEVSLRNSKTKTLILWGDKDRVLHVSGAKILQSVMPNAKSVIMKDVGHVPMLEKPEDSAIIFINFIGKVES